MTSARSKILVLGGGFAGMFAAKELERRCGWNASIELINNTNYFVFQPLLPEVAAGSISTRDAVTSLRRLLPGVKVRQAEIYDVDLDRGFATVFQGQQRRHTEVAYDHLVIALGQSVDLSRMPGLTDHALTMKTLGDGLRLRNHVIDKLEHADITELPEVKKELLTFVVVGGGFSGCETIGEMKELIERSLPLYPNIDPEDLRIVLYEFADRLLGELSPSLGRYAERYLRKRGVDVRLNTGIAEATATALVTSSGEVMGTRTIVATIGNAPSALTKKLKLPSQGGRIQTNRFLQVEGFDNVWSLGDAALIPMRDNPNQREDFAPPTAQFAVREARTLASNIERRLEGKATKPFTYKSKGALASLGARRGVAEIYGVRVSGVPAWVLWKCYYLSFVPGFATKVRIAVNWILDGLLGRSTVQTKGPAEVAARYVRYRAGDRVFEDGNRADGFYSVTEGAFELRITDPVTGEESITKIDTGGHFGERVLLGEGLRTGTVRALEDSRALVLAAEDFRRLTEAFPTLGEYFSDHIDRTFRSGSKSAERSVR